MHDAFDAVTIAQDFARRVVIGVGVGVDRVEQIRGEEFRQGDVLVCFGELRIDDDAFLFLGTPEEIRKATAGPYLLEKNLVTTHGHLGIEQNVRTCFVLHELCQPPSRFANSLRKERNRRTGDMAPFIEANSPWNAFMLFPSISCYV